MKRIIVTVAILLVFSFQGFTQDYGTAIGVRGTYVSGLTIKHFFDETKAGEGILAFGRWGFNVTGLYEFHAPAFDAERLKWYYGGGAHLGQWNDDYPSLVNEGANFVMGIDGILGLEYKIKEIPITLSADWKPTFNLTGYPGFWGYGGALSIRFTL